MVPRLLKLGNHPISPVEHLVPITAPLVNTAISGTMKMGVIGKRTNVTTNTAARNAAKKVTKGISA